MVCTFPAVDTRALVPALSHFSADLDARRDRARRDADRAPPRNAASTCAAPRSQLVPLVFAPRASHGRAAERVYSVTQAPFLAEDFTQASTKATPATPSSRLG